MTQTGPSFTASEQPLQYHFQYEELLAEALYIGRITPNSAEGAGRGLSSSQSRPLLAEDATSSCS